jgi:hypothetical protein
MFSSNVLTVELVPFIDIILLLNLKLIISVGNLILIIEFDGITT